MIDTQPLMSLLTVLVFASIIVGGVLLLVNGAADLKVRPLRGHSMFWSGGVIIAVMLGGLFTLPVYNLPTVLVTMGVMAVLIWGLSYIFIVDKRRV